MGVEHDVYDLEDSDIGEFYVSMMLRHRKTNSDGTLSLCMGQLSVRDLHIL
jgi:hypothetical protein